MADPPPASPSPRRRWDAILVAVFLAMIAMPPIATVVSAGSGRSQNEGRELSGAPPLSLLLQQPMAYLRAFAAFYDDRFGFRQELLTADSTLRYSLLGESISPKVIAGRDGWLFYVENRWGDTPENLILQHRGGVEFTEDQLDQLRRNVGHHADDAADRGARFLFFIAPNPSWIHPERLPRWVGPAGDRTVFDQVQEALRERPGIEVLDLRDDLRAAARGGDVYFPLGAHWNWEGALVADRSILRALGSGGPAPSPFDPEAMRPDWKVAETGMLRMMSLDEPRVMSPFPTPRHGWRAVEAEPPFELPTPADHFSQWYVRTTRLPGVEGPRVLVYHDSYIEQLQPYLSEQFPEVTYIWDLYRDVVLPEDYRPDIVLFEVAERALPHLCREPKGTLVATPRRDGDGAIPERQPEETPGVADPPGPQPPRGQAPPRR